MNLLYRDVGTRATALGGSLAKVYGDEGICYDVKLSSEELAPLSDVVTESWLNTIRQVAPDKVEQFRALGIDNYRQLSHLLDHARLWTAHTRTLSAQVDVIHSFGLFESLQASFPGSNISSAMAPYGDLGRPRINWRLVRPGDGTDIGPIHADYRFDAVLEDWRGEPGPNVRLKIWIPIFLEEGTTGFAYVPGSHLRQYPFWRVHIGNGLFKPDLTETDLDRPLQTLPNSARHRRDVHLQSRPPRREFGPGHADPRRHGIDARYPPCRIRRAVRRYQSISLIFRCGGFDSKARMARIHLS